MSSAPANPDPGASKRFWRALRQFYPFARPDRWTLTAGFLAYLAATSVGLVLPLGVRSLLDTALVARDGQLLNGLTLGLLGLFLLRFGLTFAGSFALQLVGERTVVRLRSKLFEHLLCLDLKFFQNERTGDLMSRLASDAGALRGLVTENLVNGLLTVLQILGALVIMLTLDGTLAAVVLLTAPVSTLTARGFGPRLEAHARRLQEWSGRAMTVVQEAFTAVPVVKSFVREPHEARRFNSELGGYFDASRQSARTSALFRGLLGLLTATVTIAIFWAGGHQVLNGRLSAGDLVAFLFYSQMISQGLGQLAQLQGDFFTVMGASGRVFETLALQPAVASKGDARRPATVRGELEFEQVGFGYEAEREILKDFSFRVLPGETVGIVGLSGAGKSTLLQLLPRFYDPTSGVIRLDGQDLRDLDLAWLRGRIGVVSQDVVLFGGTVRDNIRYGRLEATDDEVEAAALAAHAHEFVADLPKGYDTPVGERGVKLSGGQRQRLALARALLKDAPILILDEATSAVDTLAERSIQATLESGARERTTLIVAHRLATVRHADRILLIEAGRVAASGRHDELMTSVEAYRWLVAGQAADPLSATAVSA